MPIKVKKWIRHGELSKSNKTQEQLLEECGRLLDSACSHEILGEVLFKGTDGKYYTITVEAVIAEANPEYVEDTLKEEENL